MLIALFAGRTYEAPVNLLFLFYLLFDDLLSEGIYCLIFCLLVLSERTGLFWLWKVIVILQLLIIILRFSRLKAKRHFFYLLACTLKILLTGLPFLYLLPSDTLFTISNRLIILASGVNILSWLSILVSYFFFLGLWMVLAFWLCLVLLEEEGRLAVWVGIAYFLFGGAVWLMDHAIIFLAMWTIFFSFLTGDISFFWWSFPFLCLFITNTTCSILTCSLRPSRPRRIIQTF